MDDIYGGRRATRIEPIPMNKARQLCRKHGLTTRQVNGLDPAPDEVKPYLVIPHRRRMLTAVDQIRTQARQTTALEALKERKAGLKALVDRYTSEVNMAKQALQAAELGLPGMPTVDEARARLQGKRRMLYSAVDALAKAGDKAAQARRKGNFR